MLSTFIVVLIMCSVAGCSVQEALLVRPLSRGRSHQPIAIHLQAVQAALSLEMVTPLPESLYKSVAVVMYSL